MEVGGAFFEAESEMSFRYAFESRSFNSGSAPENRSRYGVRNPGSRQIPDIPIVVLTSFEDGPAAAAVGRAGATGFLLKDALSEELTHRLRGVAEGGLVVDQRLADAVLEPQEISLCGNELTILRLIADGCTNREIAPEMHLSPYAVKFYLARTMRVFGIRVQRPLLGLSSVEY